MSPKPPKDQHALLALLAFDAEDLEVISAHCQDAVVRLSDLAFQPKAGRFVLLLNRFDWETAATGDNKTDKAFQRRQSALRFDYVSSAQTQNLNLAKKEDVVKLLAIKFEPGTAPAGVIYFFFSGGGEIRLEVECIEAALKDLGAIWETNARPDHKLD